MFIFKKWNKLQQGFKGPKIVKFSLDIKTNSSRLSSYIVISFETVQNVLCLHGREKKYFVYLKHQCVMYTSSNSVTDFPHRDCS
jgi:hypothetical protein